MWSVDYPEDQWASHFVIWYVDTPWSSWRVPFDLCLLVSEGSGEMEFENNQRRR